MYKFRPVMKKGTVKNLVYAALGFLVVYILAGICIYLYAIHS